MKVIDDSNAVAKALQLAVKTINALKNVDIKLPSSSPSPPPTQS